MATADNSFQAAHEWDHKKVPDRYNLGTHVLATCDCGITVIGETNRNHGKIDTITAVNGDARFCPMTGRDHREYKEARAVKKLR